MPMNSSRNAFQSSNENVAAHFSATLSVQPDGELFSARVTGPSGSKNERALKICLLGVAFDSPNLGVGALTDGAIRGILKNFPDAEISILDYGYRPLEFTFELDGRRAPVQLINMRFSKKFYLKNNIAYLLSLALLLRCFAPAKLRDHIARRNTVLRHLAGADVVGSIAGGDSFSDIYGLARLLYIEFPQMLVLLMDKKLILFPQTLGPFKTRLAQRIARFIVSRAERTYSRDYAGVTEARRLAPKLAPEKAKFCYDVGFLVEPQPPANLHWTGLPAEKQNGSCLVGLNVSGLLYAGGYNRKNMFGLRVDYKELIDAAIQFLIETKDATILLVPHVWPEPDSERFL